MKVDSIIIILSVLSLILSLVYFLIPRVYKFYFSRPKLFIEINPNTGITKRSSFIDYHPDTDRSKPVNRPEVVKIYELNWKFNLTIRNNSEVNSYNIKLLRHVNQHELNFNGTINKNKSILSHQELTIPFEFTKIVESNSYDFENHFTNRPSEFKNLMLLLTYENQFGKVFYSRYFFNTDKTDFNRIKDKELVNWK